MNREALRQLPLLIPLDDQALAALEAHSQWAWYQPGDRVVSQGEHCHDFFLIARGQVEAVLEGEIPTRLGLYGPGEFFGEFSAVTGEPASATIVAREATSLLRLDREGFFLLLDSNGELNRQIIATLSLRMNAAGARLHRTRLRERSLADLITRQGASRYPEWAGTGPWSQRVRAAIARGSRTLEPVLFAGETGVGKELAAARMHFNSARRDGPFIVLHSQEFSEPRWREALRMAAHGTLLLKRADLIPPEAAEWIREALPSRVTGRRGELPGAAPRLMLTVAPTEEREPTPLEEAVLAEGFAVPIPPLRERREDIPALVRHLLRRRGHLPAGEVALHPISQEALRRLERYPFLTANVRELDRALQQAALLAAGGTIQVEHLRLGPVAGRRGPVRLALALGGGAVRGTAHVGVLKALAEEGIAVDLIVGTSAGALVGALYAGGLPIDAMERLISRAGWLDLAEPCWPRGGFLTSRRMRSFFDRLIGPARIEELKIPFAAVAGDATTGQEVILREGPVADAVRASTAIPGIFRPVELDGRLLVDGVVVNNVPASVARALGADLVVAVDITEYTFAPRPPRSLGEAVMRAFDIMARQTINASLEWADVVIRPPVGGLNGFSFKSADQYLQRGYEAARAAIPEIKARLSEARQRAF
ncbi:MAG: patatin-like phospholipase family protein [Bacillota bacterium]